MTAVRTASAADLAQLQHLEDAADLLLTDLLHPASWGSAPAADERATATGFVLVAAEQQGGPPVGFVQVLEVDGLAHLEQLSVLPEHGRRGHGRALVDAAKREAARRGHDRITLRSYADVPWNAPFYRSAGFVESTPEGGFLTSLVAREAALGLDRYGRRIQMTALLGPGSVSTPAAR